MQRSNRSLGVIVIVVLLIAGLPLSACQRESGKHKAEPPAHIERIEGTTLSRVTLAEKAVERLGIETAPVRVVQVERKRMVRGDVVALPAASVPGTDPSKGETVYRQFAPGQVVVSGQAPSEVADRSRLFVRVSLPQGDKKTVARGQPARVLPLARDYQGPGLTAQPVAEDDDEDDDKDDDKDKDKPAGGDGKDKEKPAGGEPQQVKGPRLHYVVSSERGSLAPGQRVRVELTLKGSGTRRKVVPFAAVLYDMHGKTWVYTSPTPRTYVRHQISVDYIDGDLAILSDGPPADTAVVTVGASLLLGTELGFGN
jgi:hypothetical protein